MALESENTIFFIERPVVALGKVVMTPDAPLPYKVVFGIGDQILSEQAVATMREAEALIRRELRSFQFTPHEERPSPDAPEREHNKPFQ